jgi:hypothetical protein
VGLGDKYVDRFASADRDLFDRQPLMPCHPIEQPRIT